MPGGRRQAVVYIVRQMGVPPTVLTVVGARPQFIKAAVVSAELRSRGEPPFREFFVHTGQHYDTQMSEVFFRDLGLREPDANLGVGSNTPGRQLADMVVGLEQLVKSESPIAVLGYGDTNSTLAAAIVASQNNLPFIHVEAGERIYRRKQMPEETNRVICDNIAHLCLAATRRAERYLAHEGFNPSRVVFTGDTMFDLFLKAANGQVKGDGSIAARMSLRAGDYHVATIHRPENTDDDSHLRALLETLDGASKAIVLPVHPRLRQAMERIGYRSGGSLVLCEPLGYFDLVGLLLDCHRVVTDSGGVSREAFFAGKPCLIPMPNIHWQEIVDAGWCVTTGSDFHRLGMLIDEFDPAGIRPEGLFGAGDAGTRIVDAIGRFLGDFQYDANWAPE
ncbi:UDP-N-acetyl glucosamine 2-epimerase [Kamptonema cortianum]|nr:UDP-N-acetyl glucosamine 2-epimerase [Kamptonema cortianum]